MNKKVFNVFAKQYVAIVLLLLSSDMTAIFPINLERWDEVIFQTLKYRCGQLELGVLAEGAVSTRSRNECGCSGNVLQLWNERQDALAMIRGFNPDSQVGELAALLNNANDDRIRGNFDVSAKLRATDVDFVARYYLPYDIYFSLFFPMYFMQLEDVQLKDLTEDLTFQDFLVREFLTNNIRDNVERLGCLRLAPWSKAGPGDLVLTLGWQRNFAQDRPWLKNVKVEIKGGATFPTGLQADEDLLFPIPFGNDGSYGIFVGGNLILNWANCVMGGIDLRFYHQFGHTKIRRIKTEEHQTDLFLLAKANTFKDYGLTQEYYMFLQSYRFLDTMSFKFAYNYIFHQEDELCVIGTNFSSIPANTAQSLEDWTIHSLVFMVDYEWRNEFCDGLRMSLFYKQPINGRNSVQATTLGAEFNYAF